MRLSHRLTPRRLLSYCSYCIVIVVIAAVLSGCGTTLVNSESGGPVPTSTPQSPCVQYITGATPFQSVNGVPGLQLPAGTYIGPATTSGGGAGQYTIATYMFCFQGDEAAINGGILTPSATPTSTLGYLVHDGWEPNNLFPDNTTFGLLRPCSNAHNCLNTSGSGSPFTFIGFDQYASHSDGYTTFQMQVATIAAPACLNDSQYYSGTPKYILYEDGGPVSGPGDSTYHFQMPPGTRVSTFKGGGTAGSTYVYFCSAGTTATIVSFLKLEMQYTGYTISDVTSSGFSAATGSNPTYRIDVSVPNPNNYTLRVFIPM